MIEAHAALAASTARASACRASIRPCSAPSTACRASSRRPPSSTGCGSAGVDGHQFRPDLRAAAPDRRVLPRHGRRCARACARTASRCSAMRMCPLSRSTSARSTRPSLPDSLERHRPVRRHRRRAGARPATCGSGSIISRCPTTPWPWRYAERTLRRNFQGYTTDPGERPARLRRQRDRRICRRAMCRTRCRSRAYVAEHRGRPARHRQGLRAHRRRPAARRHHRAHHVRFRRRSRRDLRAAWSQSRKRCCRSAPRLKPLISDGVVELDGDRLAVDDQSRFLVRSVAAAFDAHLDPANSCTAGRCSPSAGRASARNRNPLNVIAHEDKARRGRPGMTSLLALQQRNRRHLRYRRFGTEMPMPFGSDDLVDDSDAHGAARRSACSSRSGWAASAVRSRCFHTVDDACREHGIDRDRFLAALAMRAGVRRIRNSRGRADFRVRASLRRKRKRSQPGVRIVAVRLRSASTKILCGSRRMMRCRPLSTSPGSPSRSGCG